VPTQSIVRSVYLSGSVPLRFSQRGPQTTSAWMSHSSGPAGLERNGAIYSGAMFGETESDEGVNRTAVKRKAHARG
jgi:hypothetical protein